MFSRIQFRLSLLLLAACAFHSSWALTSSSDIRSITNHADQLRQQWIEKSVDYYSKVMREERRKNMGQISDEMLESVQYQEGFLQLAKKHYFALRKIKDGQHRHAEVIYRRIIDEIMNEEEDGHCDHAKLAVTTLLLALHCQRMGDVKKARSVFIHFFRVVVVNGEEDLSECACSAKVLGAYALFEMKQGNINKSLEIAQKAVEFDQSLGPILNWKQFQDARTRRNSRVKP
jgi:tetratricopeptide (TPR) repeat protein